MAFCPKCGKEVDAEAAFCPSCGFSLKSPVTQATPPITSPQKRQKEPSIWPVLIGLVVIVALVVALISVGGYYGKVTLQGTASVFVLGDNPDIISINNIQFTNLQGYNYTASVNNGLYTITLPSNTDYAVSIGYTANQYPGHPAGWAYNSTCDAGLFSTPALVSVTQDFQCDVG